ncbi:GDSL-like Lipase/Acylhydrolase family [Streptomyces sp. yr375]|uniref:SGNH/GDSL hydrolase family protein n=1 Tax=Streptomyces sp. yr375 TaxID=1761906 RepID=UPI0008B7E861|nr:GDSL-type esterase/lipase family protein [Streptomyces sp. yr375]SEP97458.1 GDSL-like Lipase/Acylhydrolase family [Streptomyces sp. yr375]
MNARRSALTPQMAQYDDFVDRAETRWVPYLMYFHRADYRSEVVNTDRLGFRVSHGATGTASVVDAPAEGTVNVLAGSSTAFGVGATRDAASIPSRLWTRYAPSAPWLNLGARGYCSTQETMLYLLHREMLPPVDRIVILSGLNNLALAGLPRALQGDYGAFFFSGEYYQQMEELRSRHRKARRTGRFGLGERRTAAPQAPSDETPVTLDERLATAVERTALDLERFKVLAGTSGTRVSFALQPLATWVRETPAREEAALFAELDRKESAFWRLFGEIAPAEVGRRYADGIAQACAKHDVAFLDLNPLVAAAADPRQWLFVDRAHFTDEGYDLVAGLLATGLDLT